MKFEEAISPTLYNVHYYMPTKKETLINKAQNKKSKKSKIHKPDLSRPAANADLTIKEEYAIENFASGATWSHHVPGQAVRVPSGEKKVVRRKFPKTITINKKRRARNEIRKSSK